MITKKPLETIMDKSLSKINIYFNTNRMIKAINYSFITIFIYSFEQKKEENKIEMTNLDIYKNIYILST